MTDRNAGPGSPRMIDVRHALLQSSSRVQVAQLAKQGRKTISLLSKERIAELIDHALRQLVDRYRAAAAPVPVDPKTAAENVKELLQDFQSAAQARTDLEVSRQVIREELDVLREQVAREKAIAEGRLEEDLEKAQFLGSPEFDRRLTAILAGVFEQRKSAMAATEPPEALDELAKLQPPMQDLILRVAREERAKHRARTGVDARATSMLEKRIEKLYAQLAALENALKMISTSKLTNNQQVMNALRQLGLLNEDKYFEKKREMLKIVLDTNKVIRRDARDLEARGITLSSPRRLPPSSLAG
jgi:hypothetical protein